MRKAGCVGEMKKVSYDATVKALHELRAGWIQSGIKYAIVGNALEMLDNQHEALACKDAAIAEQARQLKEALAQVERYKAWVDDLQSGMYVNCVYCGHRYGPTETTPVSMADALKEHIEHCPEHPASKLRAELERVKRERNEAIQQLSGHCWCCKIGVRTKFGKGNLYECKYVGGRAGIRAVCPHWEWDFPREENGGENKTNADKPQYPVSDAIIRTFCKTRANE